MKKCNIFLLMVFLLLPSVTQAINISIPLEPDNKFDTKYIRVPRLASNDVRDFSEGDTPTLNDEIIGNVKKIFNGFSGGFLENIGLRNDAIHYYTENSQMSVGFGNSEIRFSIVNPSTDELKYTGPSEVQLIDKRVTYTTIALEFLGSNKIVPIVKEPTGVFSNYLVGSDEAKWVISSQYYTQVIYYNIYDKIDLVYKVKDSQLKYEFYVHPGGNINEIKLNWIGPVSLDLADEGIRVTVHTNGNSNSEFSFIDTTPINYQSEKREKPIKGSFEILGVKSYGFSIPTYDPTRLLIIDPTLRYSTYIGGSYYDYGGAIAIDGAGNAYVTGRSYSTDFPAVNAYDATGDGSTGFSDVFVCKLNSTGNGLVYSTYVSGSNNDGGTGIAIDGAGNAYVTGRTQSTDFPTVNAYDATGLGGINDVFVFKLNSTGSGLVYSTYVSGSSSDVGEGIAIDDAGNAYITGWTDSTNFPTVIAYDSTGDPSSSDVFVCKLNSTGNGLVYSTYVSGSSNDVGYGIAIDGAGNAYITGETFSTDFPTISAYDPASDGSTSFSDVFVCKLNSTGNGLVYSTYVSGSNHDGGAGIAIDGAGAAYITGATRSTDFPTVSAYDPTGDGNTSFPDVFVCKLNSTGNGLVYSTYVSGSNLDGSAGIAIDGAGAAYITGATRSTDFPTVSAYDPTGDGSFYDVFVFKLMIPKPIHIDSNDDFAALGFPGEGTASNPYIIDGYHITNSTTTLVHIQDTTAYFVISNCFLDGVSGSNDGIYLSNVIHGTIEHNIIHSSYDGIELHNNCNENTINHNTINNNYGDGILLYSSPNNNTIWNNTIYNNRWRGIYLYSSHYNTILSNIIYNNSNYGIYLGLSSNNSVLSNTISNNSQHGICLSFSINNTIMSNTNYNNSGNGITLWSYSNNNTIRNNTISNNSDNGIYLSSSSNNTIWNNTVFNNSQNGIYIYNSANNTISNNTIYNNSIHGVLVTESENITILGNEIYDNGVHGVFLISTDWYNITDNDIYNNGGNPIGSGISIDPSFNGTVFNNTIYNNSIHGMEVTESENITILGNEIYDNGVHGVFLISTDWYNITDNDIYNNGGNPIGSGISIDPSFNGTVFNNTIYNNSIHGVDVTESEDITILGNEIYDNGVHGVFLNSTDWYNITDNDIHNNGGNPIGSGISIDPSFNGTVFNNTIYNNSIHGMEVIDSEDITILGNEIYDNGVHGMFLNSTDWYNITDNDIHNNGGNPIGSGISIDPSFNGIVFNNTIYNNSIHGMEVTESEDITILGNEIYDNGVHGVFLNSTDSHNITDNYIHDNGGSGVVVDPSNKGSISENLIYRNSEYGIFLLNSGNTDINNNVIVNNELYGIKISSDSNDNTISYNDFIGNNLGGTSQAYDDGLNNLFTNNYFIDHDNTDKNNDGIADTSYPIDGSEENVDSSPSASPIQPLGELDLEIEELVAYIEFYPEVLNLKSKDQWVTVYITLPEGYSATNIDVSTIHIDGDIYAESAKVKDSRTLKVKFDRQELISYLESLDLNLPSEVNINITGLLNGHLVRFNGVVQITVFKKGGKQLSGFTIVILFWAMIAIVLRRRIFKKSTPINSI